MREKLEPLTSLRFFAALAILVHHFLPEFVPEHASIWLAKTLRGECFAGVTLFFVLSGFVLAYNYADALGSPSSTKLRDFYVARFARVYPLFLLTFCLMLPFAGPLAGKPSPIELAAYNLTLTHAFVPNLVYYFAFNSPSWSISAEAFFYAAFPVLLIALSVARINTPRRAALTGLALAAAWFAYAGIMHSSRMFHWYCYIFPVARLFDFSIGVCCGIAFAARAKSGSASMRFGKATWIECALLLALPIAMIAGAGLPYGIRLGPLYTPLMAGFILLLAAGRGAISALLRFAPLRVLGEASYALYLLHWPAMKYFNHYRTSLGMDGAPGWLCAILLGGATILASVVVHYAFERPARDFLRRALGSSRKVIRAPKDRARMNPPGQLAA